MKDSPSPPPAPAPVNPAVAINAQAKALPSYYGPEGTYIYSGDPAKGTFQAKKTFSPDEQAKYDARNEIAQALLGRTSGAISTLPGGNYEFTGDTDPTTNRLFSAQQKLLDPVFARDEERERQRLSNQGIPEGSEAYTESMDDFGRRKSDAYEQAAAGALGQGFQQDIATRQQRFNEIAQALGGSQLAPVGNAGSPIDTASAYSQYEAGRNRQYQGELAGYNAGVAGNNATMGGLFGLGAAALPLIFSDRRLKRDIHLVGELMPGIGWYLFNYVWDRFDEPPRQGVMADEVESAIPSAVYYTADGFAMVDYAQVFAGRTVH